MLVKSLYTFIKDHKTLLIDHHIVEYAKSEYMLQVEPSVQNEDLRSIERGFLFAKEFNPRLIHFIKTVSSEKVSTSTIYRHLHVLESIGLAKLQRGKFEIKTGVISQPLHILKKLLPSLIALKKARRFGRSYSDSDIKFAMDKIQDKLITLDYKAWELTEFQTPEDLFIYVDDVDQTSAYLKENGFSEGRRGHIVLLPKIGNFENVIERVYLDSIANGGRSILDAIAIDLQYKDQLTVKGQFLTEDIMKVQEDMPVNDQIQA